MRIRILGFALALLCTAVGSSQQAAPDFSGIWKWNSQKSRPDGPPPENMRVKIEQHANDLTMTMGVLTREGEELTTYRYRVGSDDNQNTMHGAPMKSSAKWKDGALVIDSVAKFGDAELRLGDLWTLSSDGRTLSLAEHHQFGNTPPGDSTIVFEKQVGADWAPPAPPKPAEEVFKNIQVLKGMPANQLRPTMFSFTRALGVKCDFCHSGMDFEKDDKPEKQTAREMIRMATQVNKDNFGGKMRVRCWTCHRGSTEPESEPKGN
jgi:hypothetical protein